MRIFATADLPADFAANGEWLAGLSRADYKLDVLVVAGDKRPPIGEGRGDARGAIILFRHGVFRARQSRVMGAGRGWELAGEVRPTDLVMSQARRSHHNAHLRLAHGRRGRAYALAQIA